MIDEFRPFMTQAQIDKFRGFLVGDGRGRPRVGEQVDPAAAARLGLTPAEYAATGARTSPRSRSNGPGSTPT